MLALPSLLLAVAIVAILGPGMINTVIAIAIVSLPSYVRLTRAAVMGELNRVDSDAALVFAAAWTAPGSHLAAITEKSDPSDFTR